MTRQREPVELEPGDWIVCVCRNTTNRSALGGPWTHGKLLTRGVGGWNAKPATGPDMFVTDNKIVRVCLSRGEAIDLADKLNDAQTTYAAERLALKPKFEQRIRDLLNS